MNSITHNPNSADQPNNPEQSDIKNQIDSTVEKSPVVQNSEDEPGNTPQIVLKPKRALPFFGRHPWVFAGAIAHVERSPQPGDVVDLLSNKKEFIAKGLFNPNSNIRVRLYSWNQEEKLENVFWQEKIEKAIQSRLLSIDKNDKQIARRLVSSEADGLSGLTVDMYGKFVLIQLTSLAISKRLDDFLVVIKKMIKPEGIWLRTEKGIKDQEGLELSDGLISGNEPETPLFITENGIQFGIDVKQGQKTGFYLDQRTNREAISKYVKNHDVLDLFCYTGGFSLACAKLGNAKSVTGIDSSENAIQMAKSNALLNGVTTAKFKANEVFKELEQLKEENKKFDTIILDPPKMTRHRAGLNKAMKGYYKLNEMAVDLLKPHGILLTCSCSGLVSVEKMQEMLSSVAANTNRNIQILEQRNAAPDHPVSVHCLENQYLKCFICRVV